MKNSMLRKIGGGILTLSMFALFAQMRVCAQDVATEKSSGAEQSQGDLLARPDAAIPGAANALEGSWTATVTFRVCQTGAAIRSFPSMNTFERGGTLQEFGLGSAPLTRGPGHGVWQHLSERRFYSTFQFFRFNADGTPAGTVRARRYMEVDFLGNNYTATSTTEFYDNNGILFMTGCATETAVRFY